MPRLNAQTSRISGAFARLLAWAGLTCTLSASPAYAFDFSRIPSDLIAALLVGGFVGAMAIFVATRARTTHLIRSASELRDGTELLLRDGGAALLYWNLVKGELCWSESFFAMLGRILPGPMLYRDMRELLHPDDDLYEHRRSAYPRGERRCPRLFPAAGRRWRLALVRFARPHQAARPRPARRCWSRS